MSAHSSRVVSQARDWLGTPFRHQGRSRYGVDCVGLVLCVYQDLGITLPDDPVYQREVRDDRLYTICQDQFSEVGTAKIGDVLQFHVEGFPTPHVAIHAGETIIHAFYRHGKVIEQVPWKRGPITLKRVLRFHG